MSINVSRNSVTFYIRANELYHYFSRYRASLFLIDVSKRKGNSSRPNEWEMRTRLSVQRRGCRYNVLIFNAKSMRKLRETD